MADAKDRPRARLAARLRALRADVRQDDFAFRLGWNQPKVSKLETARQLPSEEDITAWAAATDSAAVDELTALRSAALREYVAWRTVTRRRRGLAAHQTGVAALEEASTRIDEYQPAMVPGWVQTPEYATELLGLAHGPAGGSGPLDAGEVADVVAARMRRGDVLYRPGRRVRLVVGEAALWSAPGRLDTLRGQLGKLQTVAELPGVELGVVPLRRMPVMPLSGFRVYDGERVVVESLAGEQSLIDSDVVSGFARAFDLLMASARTGEAAVAAIREVLASLDPRCSSR